MQRATYQLPVVVRTPAAAPAATIPLHVDRTRAPAPPTRAVATADVKLSPEGTFFSPLPAVQDRKSERRRQLATVIRQRIESRLAGRIRDLVVRIMGDTVVLEGQCATYYSKQLAQHAALGVLESEHLENAIVVP